MKRLASFPTAILLLLGAVLTAAAGAPSKEGPVISIVAATEATNVPDARRAQLAFDLAHNALNRPQAAHPHGVVLMYVNEETARAHGLPKHANVMVVHVDNSPAVTYYVWVVGEATDERLAVAMVMVLNREWELKLSKKQIDEAAYRVRLGLAGVVSARDLARESETKTSR